LLTRVNHAALGAGKTWVSVVASAWARRAGKTWVSVVASAWARRARRHAVSLRKSAVGTIGTMGAVVVGAGGATVARRGSLG
jgi:hypothetical protein